MIARGDAGRLPFADRTFDLCIGSPPYMEARLYHEKGKRTNIARACLAWVEWMLDVTTECLRVTNGPVIWVCAGVTRKRNYQPGPEGLLWEWWKRGGECHDLRPFFWHRPGIPGSGGDQWFRSDVEYALCFKRPGKLPYANPLANGHAPKWAPGGEMSHRLANGARVDQWGGRGDKSGNNRNSDGSRHSSGRPSRQIIETVWDESEMDLFGETVEDSTEMSDEEAYQANMKTSNNRASNGKRKANKPRHAFGGPLCTTGSDGRTIPRNPAKHHTKRKPDGEMQDQFYDPPVIANPGNWLSTSNGGGNLGHMMAHQNEAPYNVKVPAFFINSHCPPNGLVLDCFSGSGTTGQAALELGRRYMGVDLRQSQCLLSRKRLGTVTPGFSFSD